MKRDASSPKAYRESVEGDQRALLEAIREIVIAVDAEIEEGIRYGMLDYPGLANLAAQKHYVALYVAPEPLAAELKANPIEWKGIDRGKSCLRYKRWEQIDKRSLETLLEKVRAFRLKND